MENEIQTEVKTTTCLNCGTEFEGKFCPECGQGAVTGRFTLRFIWENLLAAVLGRDGGIAYTFKNLFSRPGKMIVEILDGKRRKYFSPFPMLFFVLAIYLLIASFTGSRDEYDLKKEDLIESTEDYQGAGKIIVDVVYGAINFYNHHYTACYLLTLPLWVFAARVCYGKQNRKRYYVAEYVIAIVYSMVIVVLYQCLNSLVYLASSDVADKFYEVMPLIIVIALTVCFWKMLGFGIVKTTWRSILVVALYAMQLIALAIVAGIILIGYIYVHQTQSPTIALALLRFH